jgi:hypothetical protein
MYNRPSRLHSLKDKQYHLIYTRACLEDGYNHKMISFQYKCEINWNFYKGEQWLFAEDLDPFFMDDSGETRNRIKFIQNIIRPYIEYFRGSIIRMDMAGQAQSATNLASDRREASLQKIMMLSYIANNAPKEIQNFLRKDFGVEKSDEETMQMFQNLYKDEFIEDINSIISHIATENDIETEKILICENIAVTGIAAELEEEMMGRQIWTSLDPKGLILDRSARRPDFKDGEYIGYVSLVSIADIAERYPNMTSEQLSKIEQKAISNYTKGNQFNIFDTLNGSFGRIPIVKMFWRDIERVKWVAIFDENNNPKLEKWETVIEDLESQSLAKKVMIPIKEMEELSKENEWLKTTFYKNKKWNNEIYIHTDLVRFTEMITYDMSGSLSGEEDIIAFGVVPHQTEYSYRHRFVDYPIKVATWSYSNGDILSPIDTLISPQRFLNRMLSMSESRINNSRGSGVFYDRDMISSTSDEAEVLRDMNLGKPIGVESGGNLNNSVMAYGNDLGSGTIQLFNVIQTMKSMAESVMGGGESLTGQGGSYRASAKVAQQNLNQGTTMQEPVFFAVSNLIMSMYNSMANKGRRILASNRNELEVVVGTDTYRPIQLSKHLSLEEYRVRIVRGGTPEKEAEAANEILMMLRGQQMLSEEMFAEAYGKTTINGIGAVLRKESNIKIEMARKQAQAQEEEAKKQAEAQKAAMEAEGAKEDYAADMQQQQMQMSQNQPANGAQQQQQDPSQQLSFGEASLVGKILDTKNNL